MIVGLGEAEDAPALYAAGAEDVFPLSEIDKVIRFKAFRAEDTLLLAKPRSLKVSDYRTLIDIAEGRGLFQVIGHEPIALATDGDIDNFRDLRPVVSRTAPVKEAVGRKGAIPYSLNQAEAIIRKYHSTTPLAEVVTYAEQVLGVEAGTVKDHWVKMLARKYVGHAKRRLQEPWGGIEVDLDGRPVHTKEDQG
ncbi:hypothetical protein [Shimia ponticola]|uniref:hypothetical protein n=1 Tax=Shimia ponticola TaxID=2582893 RepID=UPI0011BDE823|nr:hypothetical protein [Shimia ponticola]